MDTTMSRNNMSVSDQKAIANLSFEKYLTDSIESFKSIKKADNDIIQTDKSFEESIKLIKKTYQSMSKESVEAEEVIYLFPETVELSFVFSSQESEIDHHANYDGCDKKSYHPVKGIHHISHHVSPVTVSITVIEKVITSAVKFKWIKSHSFSLSYNQLYN